MSTQRMALAALALSLASCSATQLAGEWQNPKHAGKKFRRVFVLGVTKDTLGRRLFEDSVLRRVKEAGGEAVASYTVLPSEEKLSKADVAARVQESGADLVLVGRLVGRRKEYVQHHTSDFAGPPMGRVGWYGYYDGGWDSVHSTTYTTEYEVLELGTQLLETASEDVVWLASWETTVESGREQAVESFTEALVAGLLAHLETTKPVG